MRGACDLADALSDFHGDWQALARQLDHLASEHIEPFYIDQAANDGVRLLTLRHTLFGAPPPTAPADDETRVTAGQLRTAAAFDATLFRAFWMVLGMLCPPDDVYTDPEVVARTHEVIRSRGVIPAFPQPTRQELEDALGLRQ